MILLPEKWQGAYDLHVTERDNYIAFTVRGIDPDNGDDSEQIKTAYLSRSETKLLCKAIMTLLDD